MRRVIIWMGSWLILKVLSLRYRIEVKGFDQIKERGGNLFLPNHSAEIDTIITYNLLARKFHPRPLVIEHFYYLRGARFFMDLIRAFPIPNFDLSANSWKIRQVEKGLKKISEGIKKGENYLIYPSGQLKREGYENIGGSSLIHRLLNTCPDTRVVLMRIDGLWGSSFSCAITGDSPDFWKVLGKGIKTVLKNALFFTPRRKVTVELMEAPSDFPRKGSRLELNQYLEKWYNQYQNDQGEMVTVEPLRLISYSCFSKDLPIVTKVETEEVERQELDIPDHIREDVYRELKKISGMKEIKEEMDLSRDLGLDSLDLAGVHAFIDQRYNVEATHVAALKTVYDLLYLIANGSVSRPKTDPAGAKKSGWPKEPFRPSPQFPEGKTIPEAFLDTVDRMGKGAACGDNVSKIMSYQEIKLGIMVIARKLKTIPEKYVGVLLPSSVGCNLIVLSLLFAGKVPVMLNWTAGERGMNTAKDLLGLKTVLSSRRFLERVQVLELGELEESLFLLEDFRRTISFWDKALGFFLSRKKKKVLTQKFQLNRIDENDPAVILFTSGTENYPKGVPLSHKNLLSNERGALGLANVKKEDVIYGVLPPFHSFGFSVTGLLPLLAGLRVFYAPDPTDSHGMARDCASQKITILCLAPSFYRNLFRIATPRQLKSVRLFVAGAEKAPPELFEHVKRLGGNKEMIEGYGITECSPIVTLNQQGKPPRGVGYPLPGIEMCVIHPETKEKLPNDQEGEICIHGPNVFEGYLGEGASDPFIEIDGKKWYRSGDLGHLDPEGALILGGRLKRFVKIGGEMVSLIALEDELISYARKKELIKKEDEEPQLAIGVKEGEKPALVLFTTFEFSKEEGNKVLKEGGFPRIVKLAAVHQIESIPITGTGKVQLRQIQELLKEKDA
ncbi:MAG: AMP-binding protein [Chlamydiia bacterium]|nr:AMP-binding protein [Chlamydiia bacterium]